MEYAYLPGIPFLRFANRNQINPGRLVPVYPKIACVKDVPEELARLRRALRMECYALPRLGGREAKLAIGKSS